MEVEGNYDKLLGRIQERHGAIDGSIKKWIDSLGALKATGLQLQRARHY